MKLLKRDTENKFVAYFDTETGHYARTGIIDDNGKDTGIDPFMTNFPELIDVGIMQTCVCAALCNVDCYQKAISRTGENMSVENFKRIVNECKGRTFQFALGGAGDVDTHEHFEEILSICRENYIVPNFTTSGIAMTKEKAEICKKYCGAVAVSEHFAPYTDRAIDLLLDAGVKTNIHYVLSNKSIDVAIDRLRNNSFKEGINAVVFLLYKPVGLGKIDNMLTVSDSRMPVFFNLIDDNNLHHKIGFDSCTCPGIINFTKKIDLNSIDFCEGARFSAYIDSNMNMMPCSFANQNPDWFVNLKDHTIESAWNSEIFNKFRYSLRNSCSDCPKKIFCGGGCPIVNNIVLCDKKERNFVG